jgi:hypothetical protein
MQIWGHMVQMSMGWKIDLHFQDEDVRQKSNNYISMKSANPKNRQK